jgi:hypothetical protein
MVAVVVICITAKLQNIFMRFRPDLVSGLSYYRRRCYNPQIPNNRPNLITRGTDKQFPIKLSINKEKMNMAKIYEHVTPPIRCWGIDENGQFIMTRAAKVSNRWIDYDQGKVYDEDDVYRAG